VVQGLASRGVPASGGVRERLPRLAELPDPSAGPQAAEETFARAVEHGDEHLINSVVSTPSFLGDSTGQWKDGMESWRTGLGPLGTGAGL
jgi:hypothetical protein